MTSVPFDSILPFEERSRCFLYNGGNLLVAQVSRTVHDYVASMKSRRDDPQAGRSSPRGLTALRDAGFFHYAPPTQREPTPDSWPLEEAYLLLTQACNLACDYCFNETAAPTGPAVMRPDVMRSAFDYLASHAHPTRGMRVILWGGEPLLYRDSVRAALDLGAAAFRRVRRPLMFATTTTNATPIDAEMAQWLVRAGVVVNFSIDGTRESTDRHRRDRLGRPAYDRTVEGIRTYLAAQRRLLPKAVPRARMTVTSATARTLARNFVHLWEIGIPYVWCKDVDWLSEGDACSLTFEDFQQLDAQYGEIRAHIYRLLDGADGRRLDPQLRADLGALHRRERRQSSCGAGFANVSILPDGTVLACYHLEGHPEFRLGHVADRETPRRIPPSIRVNVDDVATCRVCEVKHLCGGGCMAKGVAHGLTADDCWTPQCRFIRQHHLHLLRLYGHLMSSPHAERLARLLTPADVWPPPLDTAAAPHGGPSA